MSLNIRPASEVNSNVPAPVEQVQPSMLEILKSRLNHWFLNPDDKLFTHYLPLSELDSFNPLKAELEAAGYTVTYNEPWISITCCPAV